MYASRLRNRALAVSAAFTLGASGAFAQTSPFEVEGEQLDIRLGAETQSGGWTLTEGLNPDTLTVPIARRDGRVRACLALGQRAHCQEVGVGERHDFVVRSGGKDYPIFFADPAHPDIRVGACRTGAQATNKVDVVANNNGVSMVDTAHDPPQPSPGVSIMQGHKCD